MMMFDSSWKTFLAMFLFRITPNIWIYAVKCNLISYARRNTKKFVSFLKIAYSADTHTVCIYYTPSSSQPPINSHIFKPKTAIVAISSGFSFSYTHRILFCGKYFHMKYAYALCFAHNFIRTEWMRMSDRERERERVQCSAHTKITDINNERWKWNEIEFDSCIKCVYICEMRRWYRA